MRVVDNARARSPERLCEALPDGAAIPDELVKKIEEAVKFNQGFRSFRKNTLERGGTADAMEMYKNFRGREPSVEPLLSKRGLTS